MHTTAEALEKMEPAAFEKFCGEALRHIYPELAHLIPTGINAQGKTITSPIDGFSFVGQDCFAMMQATVTAENSLEGKWLSTGNKPGDVIKAKVQAVTLRQQFIDHRFCVYLVSNKRVNDSLHVKVKSHDNEYFSSIIVEQRDLVSFLDHNAEGQYLRKVFLAIDAERISVSLLKEIAKANIERYGKEMYLKNENITELPELSSVEQRINKASSSVQLLIGGSGFGKSTICFTLIRKAKDSGRAALRIRPGIVETAASIEDAIYRQLMVDHPKLYMKLEEIPGLFANGLIVIDDINKSTSATMLLDKIVSWSAPVDASTVQILCPVWPRNMPELDSQLKKQSKVESIRLGQMKFYDCKAIVTKRLSNINAHLTDQQIHSLIIDTGFDPLLIGIGLDLIEAGKEFSGNTAENAIANFVAEKLQQLHRLYQYPVALIKSAFIGLGAAMLRNGKIDINVPEIETWLSNNSKHIDILFKTAAERHLFFFDDAGKCYFRHDRVRDYILTLSAADLLKDFADNKLALADPYFSDVTGAALAKQTVSSEILESLLDQNPLAVFTSLKFLQSQDLHFQFLITTKEITKWNEKITKGIVPKAVTSAIANELTSFDTRDIDIITAKFPPTPELHLARFRNGNWLEATVFFSKMDYFYPDATTYWWNTILEHVKATSQDKIVERLEAIFQLPYKVEGIQHAYTLAGFIADPQLTKLLIKSWELYAESKFYVSYLWAVLNCFTINDAPQVKDALSFWNNLSEEQKAEKAFKGLGSRAIPEQLQVLDWKFTEGKLSILTEIASDSSLREIIALLFTYVDTPAAMEIVLDIEQERERGNYFWHDRWDERWDREKTNRRLSDASRDYLHTQFTDLSSPETRRCVAWKYWTGNCEEDIVMNALQKMSMNDTILFQKSIYWRVSHGDYSAFAALVPYIEAEPWLIRMVDSIWNKEVECYVQNWLKLNQEKNNTQNIEYFLELLGFMDNEIAENLLIENWEHLKLNRKGIGAALFLSTPQTRILADQEIKRLGFETILKKSDYYEMNKEGLYFSLNDPLSEEEKKNADFLGEVFGHIHMHFFVNIKGKPNRITKEKIEGLLPYFTLMNSITLYQLASDCKRLGFKELFEKVFSQLPKHLYHKFLFDEEELITDMIDKYRQVEKDNSCYLSPWVTEPERFKVTSDLVVKAIEKFWETHHNSNAFFVAALILEHIGTRKEIAFLEQLKNDNRLLESNEERYKRQYWFDNTVFVIKQKSLN